MTKSAKIIRWCCCLLGALFLTTLFPLSTAWANPLHHAVQSGDLQKVESLLAEGVDVNIKNRNGHTPLFGALSVEMAEVLIRNEANIHAMDRYGLTPLVSAALRNNLELTSF